MHACGRAGLLGARYFLQTFGAPSSGDGEHSVGSLGSACGGGDVDLRGTDGYQYASGDTADTVDGARTGRLHILEVQRLIRFMPKVVIAVVPGEAAEGRDSILEKRDADFSKFPYHF